MEYPEDTVKPDDACVKAVATGKGRLGKNNYLTEQ